MVILIAVAAIVGLVWGAVIFMRGGLLGGCLVMMFAGCCLGRDFLAIPGGPIPLTIDRALWLALLVFYFVSRRLGWLEPKPLGAADYVLLAFIGVLLVSTLTGDWSAHGNRPLATFLFYYVMPLGIYWVARNMEMTQRGFLALLSCLAVFGVYLAITAIAETRELWWAVYPKYIASTTNLQFFGRGRGPFLNPAACGFFQSVCLCGALLLWPRLNKSGRLMLVALSLLICLGIFSTYTRCTWLGTGLALLILAALALPRSWRMPVLGTSLIVGSLLAATQWENILAFRRDKGMSARESFESIKLRPILATVAWKMFLDRPVAGCGLGHYEDANIYYLADRSTGLPLEKARPYIQHNAFLSLLTETGLLGMGLFVLLLALWSRDAWRLYRSESTPDWARPQGVLFLALVGSYFANAMFQDVSVVPMVSMMLFFMAGVTEGLASPRRAADESSGSETAAARPADTDTRQDELVEVT